VYFVHHSHTVNREKSNTTQAMCCVLFCFVVNSGVLHIMCCVLALFVFVFNLVLPVSLDCPFVIAPSDFSDVYSLICYWYLSTNLNNSKSREINNIGNIFSSLSSFTLLTVHCVGGRHLYTSYYISV
jgi:hypothetical protein